MINSVENGKPTLKNIKACLKDKNRYTSYNGPYYSLLLAVRKTCSDFEENHGQWNYTEKDIQKHIIENKLV